MLFLGDRSWVYGNGLCTTTELEAAGLPTIGGYMTVGHPKRDAMQEMSLPAIERKDLHPMLAKYGLLDAFSKGGLLCASCATPLSEATFGALLVRNGVLVPFCKIVDCLEAALREKST
jgi:hypothetical protein